MSDFTFNGFEQSNTTPVPDVLFDELLPELRGAELKALLYIIRRTLGFKKTTDAISFNQFLNGITTKEGKVLDKGCGVKDRTTLSKALAKLEHLHCIESVKGNTPQHDKDTTAYTLQFRASGVVGKSYHLGSREIIPPVVGKTDYRSREIIPGVVGKSYLQETVLQETVLQEDTGVFAIASTPPLPLSSSHEIPIATTTLKDSEKEAHDATASLPDRRGRTARCPLPAHGDRPDGWFAPTQEVADENESHSHDETVATSVAVATGNDITTKGHTYDHTTHSLIDASPDSGLSLRHPQGAVGDTRGTTSTELSPRDETHHEDDQTPERTAQGVTKGQISGLATAPDVSCPLDGHRAVSGTHPPDAAQGLEGHDAHDPVSASPAALWPPAVVVAPLPVGPRTEETAAQVARSSHKPAVPKPEPTLDELAFKRRCDALQAHINEDWRGYALTERGPIINERMVIKKLVAAYTDTQCAQIWEYLFTRHFKFSKPDYRYTIGAQIMWEQAKNVAQILRGEKENHHATEPPRSTFVPRPSQVVVPADWAADYKAANYGGR